MPANPSLLARARAYAPLAPWERALLRLLEAWVIAGVVVALPVLIAGIKTGQYNWPAVGGAFAVGFFLAAYKYFTASQDPPLPSATEPASSSPSSSPASAPPA